jgi:tetratricopeptide (TPR) repeat protein
MTSRSRPGRCTTDRPGGRGAAGPGHRAALLLLLGALGGCGALSRPIQIRSEASLATSPDEHARLLGAEPMVSMLWAWSASRRTTPEDALAVLGRGRAFHPGDPQLLAMQLSLLARMGRFEGLIETARAALASGRPSELEVELRWWLVLARIARGNLGEAQDETVRLGGVRGVPPGRVAAAWAHLAAMHEFLGDSELADECMERSLDLGPSGLLALREVGLAQPEKRAATSTLITRARARHPGHPDLDLQIVFERLAEADIPGADAALAALAQPLPARLRSDVELVRARVDVMADEPERTARALELLRRRLDDRPGDALALGVLVECWRLRGTPSDAEMRLRVAWARGRAEDPGFVHQLRALQAELDRRTAP